ncbi:ABC transporter substrate-binding protein [Roseobacter sp. CCS2]|uniref:ABC transporter substrate-binding protein n=1 Tax=Roseobacter sp. CCS2 TaxID=391593 RepID=UPI0000F403C3|nr:ABC transporter substrate-binding protein [Roseobacter sp. CCS2]EBA13657.1 iron(III) dicitrate-binding periplasmic protein [Roseobacter sp. CCS2]
MHRIAAAAIAVFMTTPAFALECHEGFRAFVHGEGETCIPVQPERIIATRGDSVATPLIDIGAPLVAVAYRTADDGSLWLRGASDIFGDDAVAALNLANVGSPNGVDLEAVVSARPDLIVITEFQTDLIPQLSEIAPVIVTSRQMTYFEHLSMLADAAGMADVFTEREQAYRDRIAEAQSRIGDPSAIKVSQLNISEGVIEYFPNFGALTQVVRDIGLGQPQMQADAATALRDISMEQVNEFDGDIILSSFAPRFDQSIEWMMTERFDGASPVWRSLSGVQSGNHFWYERDLWGGTSFASLHAAIDGLELLTAGRTFQ